MKYLILLFVLIANCNSFAFKYSQRILAAQISSGSEHLVSHEGDIFSVDKDVFKKDGSPFFENGQWATEVFPNLERFLVARTREPQNSFIVDRQGRTIAELEKVEPFGLAPDGRYLLATILDPYESCALFDSRGTRLFRAQGSCYALANDGSWAIVTQKQQSSTLNFEESHFFLLDPEGNVLADLGPQVFSVVGLGNSGNFAVIDDSGQKTFIYDRYGKQLASVPGVANSFDINSGEFTVWDSATDQLDIFSSDGQPRLRLSESYYDQNFLGMQNRWTIVSSGKLNSSTIYNELGQIVGVIEGQVAVWSQRRSRILSSIGPGMISIYDNSGMFVRRVLGTAAKGYEYGFTTHVPVSNSEYSEDSILYDWDGNEVTRVPGETLAVAHDGSWIMFSKNGLIGFLDRK